MHFSEHFVYAAVCFWLWYGMVWAVSVSRSDLFSSFIYFTPVSVSYCFCLWFFHPKFRIGKSTPLFQKIIETYEYWFPKLVTNGYQFERALIAVVSVTKFKHLSLDLTCIHYVNLFALNLNMPNWIWKRTSKLTKWDMHFWFDHFNFLTSTLNDHFHPIAESR